MKRLLLAGAATACLALAGCASGTDDAAETPAAADCTKDALQTLTPGTLTIATGQPAFSPWVIDDDPTNGEGFEPAVAYAAAAELGFGVEDVTWVRTTFDSAIAPGPKTFDWNLQQYTITAEREAAVDFSSPYFDVTQAVLTVQGSPIDGATTVAELKDAKFGAAIGSTSLDDAEEVIDPTQQVAVFNDNAAAVAALKNGQIDGLVIDLPSAFYLRDDPTAGLDGTGTIVGQLPTTASGQPDQLGILLAKNSPLTACTSQAVDTLRESGALQELQDQWLGSDQGAPVLQ